MIGEPYAGEPHVRFGGEGVRELNRASLPLSPSCGRQPTDMRRKRPPVAANAATGAPVSVFCQVGESPAKACTLRPLAESNCVLVTRGGEQLEANEQSVD